MKKIIIFGVFILSAVIYGQNMQPDNFISANKMYESGKYSEAIDKYIELIKNGNRSSEVYYNLANSFFKERKTGYAILWYERALLISPRDSDIKYNLEYARSYVKETVIDDGLGKLLSGIYGFLSINELLVLASLLFFLLAGLVIYQFYKRKEIVFWLTLASAVIFLVISIWAGLRIYDNENIINAIVIQTNPECKAAPQESYPVSFTVPEGKKVVIMQMRENWYEVFLKAENLKGWIKKEAVEPIKNN